MIKHAVSARVDEQPRRREGKSIYIPGPRFYLVPTGRPVAVYGFAENKYEGTYVPGKVTTARPFLGLPSALLARLLPLCVTVQFIWVPYVRYCVSSDPLVASCHRQRNIRIRQVVSRRKIPAGDLSYPVHIIIVIVLLQESNSTYVQT
jgi:hypothetical protein